MKWMIIVCSVVICTISFLQPVHAQQLESTVARLDKATTANDYQKLAEEFKKQAASQSKNWLPYYYAAFCNAKIGWLYEKDGERIEPFADEADEQIKKAKALLDTSVQKKELAEVYCILSMINQARVFINPQTYGPKFGPLAFQYTHLARTLDPGNPRALYLEGWAKFATPKMWGGDKKKAKELLDAAVQQLNNKSTDTAEPHWGKKEAEDILKQMK